MEQSSYNVEFSTDTAQLLFRESGTVNKFQIDISILSSSKSEINLTEVTESFPGPGPIKPDDPFDDSFTECPNYICIQEYSMHNKLFVKIVVDNKSRAKKLLNFFNKFTMKK